MYSAQTGRRIRRNNTANSDETIAGLNATKSNTNRTACILHTNEDKSVSELRRMNSAPSIGRSRDAEDYLLGLAAASILDTSDLLRVKEAQFSLRPSSAHVRLSTKERLAPYIKATKVKNHGSASLRKKSATSRNTKRNEGSNSKTELGAIRPGTPIVSNKERRETNERSRSTDEASRLNKNRSEVLKQLTRPKARKRMSATSMETTKEKAPLTHVNILKLDDELSVDTQTSSAVSRSAQLSRNIHTRDDRIHPTILATDKPRLQCKSAVQADDHEDVHSMLDSPGQQENRMNNNSSVEGFNVVKQHTNLYQMQLMDTVSDLMGKLRIDNDWMVSVLNEYSQ